MKSWLADLPTTALVIATGCVLALLTALFFFGATIAGRPIDDGNWTASAQVRRRHAPRRFGPRRHYVFTDPEPLPADGIHRKNPCAQLVK